MASRPQNRSEYTKLVADIVDEQAKEAAAMAIPTKLSDLTGDEYWIGDTGATTHLTNSRKGMVKLRKMTEQDSVIMGNGSRAMSDKIGNVVGTVVSKDGKELRLITIENVSYSSDAKFNLFSVTLLM